MSVRGKVLILDDDEHMLETARALLERAGFDVAVYAGRFDRLNFVLRHRPDLVLLDVNMPVVPGDELYQLFREHPVLRHVPVVFFSSNDEAELRLLARQSGAHGYISKSAVAVDLPARVARYLGPTAAAR
jgi:CheY-like chemotaxis protein